MIAVRNGFTEIVQMLVKSRVGLDLQNEVGITLSVYVAG